MSDGVVIRGGTVFDGTGAPGRKQDLVVRKGTVSEESARPEDTVIDAHGCWVTPGFIDNHTHYDAELEVAPSLSESVRHGVTTVTMGSCGLGMSVGSAVDLADMFCRVEGVPRSVVKPLFERVKDWDGPSSYIRHLEHRPLGPNVAVLLGHSTIRAHVMGLGRSLDPATRASRRELTAMAGLLEEALDAGFLGLSINTLKWDKMDGQTYRSRPTPSTFAGWSEYRLLNRILRARGRVLQGVPNISTKVNVLLFVLESMGVFRPSLKTAIISMVDAKASRHALRLVGPMAWFANRFLNANLRFQSLPNVFDFWVDGIEVPVFEEFPAGTEALHIQAPDERARLLEDPDYRRRFRRQWASRFWGRAYHRDLSEARIVDCPDPSLIGSSFAEVARRRGQHAVDALLDLVATFGRRLRWYTVLGNDRPAWLRWIVRHPAVQVGFSDAGAHLRNMAHYNFPLRLLRLVKETDPPFMSVERAVHRCTQEIADWLGIDAGVIAPGRRADIVVLDPRFIDERVDEIHEAEMEGFDGLRRLVRRNDRAVRAVLIRGRRAVENGQPCPELGRRPDFGQVLKADS
ncbi:MAG: amidohydrolase family protein [Myxococcota bacterium]